MPSEFGRGSGPNTLQIGSFPGLHLVCTGDSLAEALSRPPGPIISLLSMHVSCTSLRRQHKQTSVVDQINRKLVYQILEAAGCPGKVLVANRAYMENVVSHNSIAGGLGKRYRKKASTPQGCPMSMAIKALLLRLWLVSPSVWGLGAYSR